MTENREDYLKIIFQLEENGITVTNKVLASKLNVSPASASQMLTKLSESGLVNNQKNAISLTDEARELAKVLVSKHRLWEAFLQKEFEYKWDEVHSDAEILEHVTSELLLERLNKFMDYPTRCPHGGRIYINEVEGEEGIIKLLYLLTGSQAKIIRFIDEPVFISFAKKIDLKIGDIITLVKKDELNELIYFSDGNTEHVISNKVSEMIFVQPIEAMK